MARIRKVTDGSVAGFGCKVVGLLLLVPGWITISLLFDWATVNAAATMAVDCGVGIGAIVVGDNGFGGDVAANIFGGSACGDI